MNEILRQLSGGDLRSEGQAEAVAAQIINRPQLLSDLAAGLDSESKLIRARTCMAMEVVSRQRPDLLADVLEQLIGLSAADTVPQVRWHVAQIFGNMALTAKDAERIIPTLLGYLGDKSKIVKYCAVQTLGGLGRTSPSKAQIIDRISALRDESKSMARAVSQALQELGETPSEQEPTKPSCSA